MILVQRESCVLGLKKHLFLVTCKKNLKSKRLKINSEPKYIHSKMGNSKIGFQISCINKLTKIQNVRQHCWQNDRAVLDSPGLASTRIYSKMT